MRLLVDLANVERDSIWTESTHTERDSMSTVTMQENKKFEYLGKFYNKSKNHSKALFLGLFVADKRIEDSQPAQEGGRGVEIRKEDRI